MSRAARTALESLLVFAARATVFYAMLAQRAAMFDYDALYHFKLARLILERGPWVDISWLPFTVLGDHGTDHHWLFHVLVAPLTLLGNDLRAVDIASAVVAALMPVALLPLLRRAAIPVAPLFAVAVMFAHSALPGRFLTLRAQDLAVVLMIAAMFAMAWRRTAWVGVVAFVFTQSYHGAVILGMILVTDAAARWIVERRFHLASVTACAVGVLAGLLAQPWFPDNVRYLVFHTFFKTAQAYPGLVGTEWVPAPFYSIAMEGWPAHLLLLSGMVAAAIAARRAGPRILGIDTLSCLGVAAFTFAMSRFAWRFLEYYAPPAVTAAGLLWRDAARHLSWTRAKAGAVAAGLAALIAVGAYRGNERVAVSLTGPFDAYAAMMRYVDANDEHRWSSTRCGRTSSRCSSGPIARASSPAWTAPTSSTATPRASRCGTRSSRAARSSAPTTRASSSRPSGRDGSRCRAATSRSRGRSSAIPTRAWCSRTATAGSST
jgi:hypothetical protein